MKQFQVSLSTIFSMRFANFGSQMSITKGSLVRVMKVTIVLIIDQAEIC